MDNLKSCPFCGGEASLIPILDGSKDGTVKCYFVICDDCYSQTNDFSTKKEATDAWNKRVK